MRGRIFVTGLGLVLAGCGASAGNSAGNEGRPGNVAQGADATAQRQIPCTVQRHGASAILNSMEGRPETACDSSVDPQTIALDELIRIIPDQHPAFYYILAQRLLAAGRGDDAVFWFYVGQLRYRIRLTCHPDLAPDTEPALFGSLQEEVGTAVNGYAGGDPAAWSAAIERARDWDAANRNGFEPKAPCAPAIAEQREGMGQLVGQIRDNADQIRRDRAANGLPNR